MNIKYIDEVEIRDKKVLLRVDFNVPLTTDGSVAQDLRIKYALPTIERLLKNGNQLILISYLGRPKGRDIGFSLAPVVKRLQELIAGYKIALVDDFLSEPGQKQIASQDKNEILVLENIRFYSEEKENDKNFIKRLAELGQVYVNDAFSVCHREEASVVGIPTLIPGYGGLSLKKEITMLSSVLQDPKKPVVVILGGAKISTKINLISRLMTISDTFLIGGGMATTFLCAHGVQVGKSLYENTALDEARKILALAKEKNTLIVLPQEVVVGDRNDPKSARIFKKLTELTENDTILDIGPNAEAVYRSHITKAETIIWNGPMGYYENPIFAHGTESIFDAITQNTHATSVVGGGDTVAAILDEKHLDKITHISTGGGAMLEYIEKGTLPGIEALKKRS